MSIKALEIAEEKEAIAQYGSSDSGASLGDILGTALKREDENWRTRRTDDAQRSHLQRGRDAARSSSVCHNFGRVVPPLTL